MFKYLGNIVKSMARATEGVAVMIEKSTDMANQKIDIETDAMLDNAAIDSVERREDENFSEDARQKLEERLAKIRARD